MEHKPLVYQFDDVRVERHSAIVYKTEIPVHLEPKTFKVLLFLLEAQGRVVEKSELLNAIWAQTFVTENALTRVVAQLRKALGDDAKGAKYIETVPTRGYRFVARVTVTEVALASNGEQAILVPSQPVYAPIPSEEPVVPLAASPLPVESADGSTGKRSVIWPSAKLLIPLLAISLILMTAGTTWLMRRRPGVVEVPQVLKTIQISTSPGLDIDPTFSPDGSSLAYSSDRGGNFEIYVKPLGPGSRELQLTADGSQNLEPAWSVDGKQIAYHSLNRGGIWLMPALGGVAKQLTTFGARPAWSPDGTEIAFQSVDAHSFSSTAPIAPPVSEIWIVTVGNGKTRQITTPQDLPAVHAVPAWSADGRHIFHCANSNIWSIDRDGGSAQLLATHLIIHSMASSSSENAVYYTASERDYSCGLWKVYFDPATGAPLGQPVKITRLASGSIGLSISAAGKRIAYNILTTRSDIWSVPLSVGDAGAAGLPSPLTRDTNLRKSSPAYSPDGRKIVFDLWTVGSNSDLWVMDADGANLRQLTSDPASDELPSWYPDNNRILFASSRGEHAGLWSTTLDQGKDQPVRTASGARVDIIGRLSPDGKTIAGFLRKGGALNIWLASIVDGKVFQSSFDPEGAGWPCWSRDSRQIAYETFRGEDTYIYAKPVDGGQATQLTFEHGQSWPGDWSPDGDKIVYAAQRDGIWNLRWVSRSTKTEKQITNYTKMREYVRYPTWSSLGNQVAYEWAETTGNIWIMELK